MAVLTNHLMVASVVLFSVPAQTKLVYVEENLPLPGIVSPPGSPWPLPQSMSTVAQQVTLDPNNFTIISNLKGCDVIDAAIHRYEHLTLIDRPPSRNIHRDEQEMLMERIKSIPDPSLPVLHNLNMHISSSCDSHPSLSLDDDYESYKLTVELNNGTAAVANLESTTIWGALRGLETFSQLVYIQEQSNFYRLNLTTVEDKPRFPHRGLLLDTARHFIPKHVLLQVLDSMSWNKLNVFHWHIVDDQSFPYESRLFKNLTEFGAYTPRHVYTQDDVNDIVQYARLRGIRVVPEFDTPGHAQGFGKAFPHLLTPCYGDGITPGTPNFPYHAAYENFDPTNSAVYDFMRSFLVDIKTTFKDYIHLGLDEVFLPCWSGSPVVRAFMEKNNYTDPREVEQHYVKEILRLAKDTGFSWITWQDPAERGIQMENNSIVQIWKDVSLSPTKMKGWREYVHDLTEKGYKVILSSCWYINFITYGQDWKNFYNCDPTTFAGTPEQEKLVLGGEAAMWGEYVDATNLMPRLWPRASAAAERLWSKPLDQSPSAEDAASRLDQHRCRMLRRGISAQPILNGFCGEWEVPESPPPMSTLPPPSTTTPVTPPSTTESTTVPSPSTSSVAPPTTTESIPVPSSPPTTVTISSALNNITENITPETEPVINVQKAIALKNETTSENSSAIPVESSSTEKSTTASTPTTTTTPTTTPTTTTTTTTATATAATTISNTTIPTTTEQDDIGDIDETENNVSPSSDVVGPMGKDESSMSDTDTVSIAPIESVDALIASVKYVESKTESNDVEEQSDSTVST